jgi:hypothetical protein
VQDVELIQTITVDQMREVDRLKLKVEDRESS